MLQVTSFFFLNLGHCDLLEENQYWASFHYCLTKEPGCVYKVNRYGYTSMFYDIFTKGNNFLDTLFAFQDNRVSLK